LTFRRTGYQTKVVLITTQAGIPITQDVSIVKAP